jgi:hypothetical protein
MRRVNTEVSVHSLVIVAKQLFPQLIDVNVSLAYSDDEGDIIMVGSENELQEALIQMAGKTLKFDVINNGRNNLPSFDDNVESSEVPIHQNVSCDMCGIMPIVGMRFKCSVRNDFDLCEKCEKIEIQPFPMIKIYHPEQNPAGIFVALRDDRHERDHRGRGPGGGRLGGRGGRGPPPPRHGGILGGWFERPRQDQDRVHGPGPHGPGPHGPGSHGPGSHGPHHPPPFKHHGGPPHKHHGGANPPPRGHFPPDAPPHGELRDEEQKRLKRLARQEERNKLGGKTWRERALELEKIVSNGISTVVNAVSPVSGGNNTNTKNDTVPTAGKKPKSRFVRDVTFPDGTSVQPGSVFNKIWRIRNDGAIIFPSGCALVNVGGDSMCREDITVPLPGLNIGEEADISIQLQAPNDIGRHVSYFRCRTGDGIYFGKRLWCDIRVNDEASSWHFVGGLSIPVVNAEPINSVSKDVDSDSDSDSDSEVLTGSSNPILKAEVLGRHVAVDDADLDVANVSMSQPIVLSQESVVVDTQDLWGIEIAMLADMGFLNATQNLAVLRQVLVTPVKLSTDPNGRPSPEGMQRVVATLLSQSGNLSSFI